ncbi:Voltage-dependent anion-selective channel protein 2, partial [Fragariocoptes setiger]
MAPPSYADLGRASRDLFSKHYHFGIVKLDVKTKTPAGVEFVINGLNNTDRGSVAASLETKYNIKSYGISLKEKWNTDNVLSGEATAEDYFVKGLKLGLSGTFAPQSGKKTVKFTSGYKSLFFNINSDVDLDYAGALFNSAGVFGYLGWLAGMKMAYDPTKNKLSSSNFALGYQCGDLHVTTHMEDGQKYECAVYQRLNDSTEVGVNIGWANGSNQTRFGIGCHYRLDRDSAIRTKVNNSSQIGLGFIHRLRPGINMTLSAMVDAKNFNQGGHKLGMGFELEA